MKPDQKIHDDDLQIDLLNLEDEWANQARLYRRYAAELADAIRDLEESKNDLELAKAQIGMDVRTNPEKYGLTKTTETSITAAILMCSDYQTVQEALIEARHAVEILKGMEEACRQRKTALENAVKLFLSEYYSDPKAPEGKREEVAEMEKKSVRRKGVRQRRKD